MYQSFIVKLYKCPNSYFLAFQLGFGSFLGIIGAHLIENKRQMVRGFILPLCIEITLVLDVSLSRQSQSTVIKLSISPNYLRLA